MKNSVSIQLGAEIERAVEIDPDAISTVACLLTDDVKRMIDHDPDSNRAASAMLLIAAAIEDAITASSGDG